MIDAWMKRCNEVCLAILLVSVAVVSTETWAAEKKKLSGSGFFVSMAGRQVAYEADNPKREMAQWTAIWTFTSNDPDFDGLVETAPTQIICNPSGCRHQGHLVFRHKNGDEIWGYFHGTHEITTNGDGTWALSTQGQKVLMGGTGRYANAKGVLKYSAKNIPFGTHFSWTGEVEY